MGNKASVEREDEFRLTGRLSLMELADRALKLSKPKVAKHRDRRSCSGSALPGMVGTVRRMMSQGKRSKSASASRGESQARYQRVAVRVSYTQNGKPGQWQSHGRYLSRPKALGESRPFGSADDPKLDQTMGAWQAAGDPRVFKVIISPEFGSRLDLERLTRETMSQLSARIGQDLEWLAASHFDTAHPHTHVIIRGIDRSGLEVRLPKSVITRELRGFAQHAATAQLGYRTRADLEQSNLARAKQWRWSRLDDALIANGLVSPEYRRARLAFLGQAGLVSDGRLVDKAKAVVQAVAEASDRQRMIRANREHFADPRLPVVVGGPLPEQGRVIAVGEGLTLVESRSAIHVALVELPTQMVGRVVDACGDLLRGSAAEVLGSLPRTHRKAWDAAIRAQMEPEPDRGR